MTEYERQIGQAALRTMGEIPNIIKCVEELAELQQALCKWMEDPTRDANTRMHVHDELADAQIMLNRMGMIFDASLVETWRGVKLDRMARTVGVTVGVTVEADVLRCCETCRNDLGGGYNNCRLNLEAECAAGGFEAWEAKV